MTALRAQLPAGVVATATQPSTGAAPATSEGGGISATSEGGGISEVEKGLLDEAQAAEGRAAN
jgi:hypothetical protein